MLGLPGSNLRLAHVNFPIDSRSLTPKPCNCAICLISVNKPLRVFPLSLVHGAKRWDPLYVVGYSSSPVSLPILQHKKSMGAFCIAGHKESERHTDHPMIGM